MHVSARVTSTISFVGAIFVMGVSSALASDANSNDCARTSSYEDDRSRATARALITYVEQYWDIATTGKPDKVSVSLVDDPSGDGTKIDFYNVQFNSFQASFYRYADGTAMPSELSTKSTKFKLPCGLRVGQSQAKVRAILGSPTHVQSESFIYATGGDQNGEVIFAFKRGKLRQVAWEYDTH